MPLRAAQMLVAAALVALAPAPAAAMGEDGQAWGMINFAAPLSRKLSVTV